MTGCAEMTSTYNGWANYETWVTNLWLTNEPWTDEQCREIVREAVEDGDDYAAVTVGDRIRELVEETWVDPITEDGPASLAVDLLRAALGEVDWREIAEAFLSDTETR